LAESIIQLTNRIKEEESAKQLSSIERLSNIGLQRIRKEFENRIELHEQKLRVRNRTVWLISILALFIFGTMLLLYKIRLQQKELRNERLESELRLKNQDISNLALDISTRKKVTQEILERIGSLKKQGSEETEEFSISMIENDLKRGINADRKRERLHQQVDSINAAFYERLRTKYPNLATTEMELCALIRSGMSSKEIAEVRGISPSSAHTARYRLRKKLGIPSEENIADVLNGI